MRRYRSLLPLLLATLLLSSGAMAGRAAFKTAFKKWTRSDELYQNLGLYASISWHATLLSEDYLIAQAHEVGRIYDYDTAQTQAYLDGEIDRARDKLLFFVSFYAFDRKNDDLAKQSSDWQLHALIDGEKIKPLKIEPIGKPSPLEKRLFPYINLWSRHYWVSFPRAISHDSTPVTLEVRGPFGHGTLSWR